MRMGKDILREEGKLNVMGARDIMGTERETECREEISKVQVTWCWSVRQGTERYRSKCRDVYMNIP